METPYAYMYLYDIDGITCIGFCEVSRDQYSSLNLEGEPCYLIPRVHKEGM